MKIKKAVILAAGLGTRVLPASKAMPKEMLPIVDKPAIQFIVEEVVKSGIDDVLIITSRVKPQWKTILIVLLSWNSDCWLLESKKCMKKW